MTQEKDEELELLLGKSLDLDEIVKSTNSVQELAKLHPNDLEAKILDESNDILEKTKYAVADVLMQVQTTPSDGELVEGAAKLLNAYTGILDSLQKIYSTKEKFKQQVQLQSLKIMADDKMNQDNNETKLIMSREQLLAALEERKAKAKTIEINAKINEGDVTTEEV